MRIERIDDKTIKFYISYNDIEQRGFNREELWMDRKRGEEFFWKLMNEVKDEHTQDFINDGPLWIQVHAFDKGLEVIVSKSQAGESYGLNRPDDFDDDELEDLLEDTFNGEDTEVIDKEEANRVKNILQEESKKHNYLKPFIVKFDDIDDLINYSYQVEEDETLYDDLLLTLDGNFYYLVYFAQQSERDTEIMRLNLLEYGEKSDKTEAVLMEYGQTLMSNNVRRTIRENFKAVVKS